MQNQPNQKHIGEKDELEIQKILKKDLLQFMEYEVANSFLCKITSSDFIARIVYNRTVKKYNNYLKFIVAMRGK